MSIGRQRRCCAKTLAHLCLRLPASGQPYKDDLRMHQTDTMTENQVGKKTDDSRSGLQALIAGIPQHKMIRIGKALGWLLYHIDARHRRIVRRNLQFAYPDWEWSHVLRVSRRVFENFGITVLEIIQSSCSTFEEIMAKAHFIQGAENIEHLSNPKGVILISAHLGNWEVAAQCVSGFARAPFVGVARTIRFKPFERWVNHLRTRFGGELINKKGAALQMREALRQGKILGTLIDQGGEGAVVRFYGREVKAHAGVALLARRCKSAVIPAFCVREKNGFRIIIDPPLELQKTANHRADIQANTQLMMSALEKAIRQYPDQWFWFHKRWKAFYPQLYKEDMQRQRRKEAKKQRQRLS